MKDERTTLSGKLGPLPDAKAVQARNTEFVQRVMAKPDFAPAKAHADALASTVTPAMGVVSAAAPRSDRVPMAPVDMAPPGASRAQPVASASMLLTPELPFETVVRALTANDDNERRELIRWAYDLDVEDAPDRDALALLERAFAAEAKRAGFTQGSSISGDVAHSSLVSLATTHPQAIGALELARASRAKRGPLDINELMRRPRRPTSPVQRLLEVLGEYGIPTDDAHIDRRPFMAIVDAIFVPNPWITYSGDGLKRAVEEVGGRAPHLRERLEAEIDRWQRMRQVRAGKEAAEDRKRNGVVAQAPAGVRIAPEVMPATAAQADEPEIVEAAMKLPTTSRRTTQKGMRFARPLPADVPPPSEIVAVDVVNAVGALRVQVGVPKGTPPPSSRRPEHAQQPSRDEDHVATAPLETEQGEASPSLEQVAVEMGDAPPAFTASSTRAETEAATLITRAAEVQDTVIQKAPPKFDPPPLGPKVWYVGHNWPIVVGLCVVFGLVALWAASSWTPKAKLAPAEAATSTATARVTASPAPRDVEPAPTPRPSVTAQPTTTGEPEPNASAPTSPRPSTTAPHSSGSGKTEPGAGGDPYQEPIVRPSANPPSPPPTAHPAPSSTGSLNIFAQ